jgi:TIR domain/NACHT domain
VAQPSKLATRVRFPSPAQGFEHVGGGAPGAWAHRLLRFGPSGRAAVRNGSCTVCEPSGVAAGDPTPAWDFFVSYTQADQPWAEWIAWILEEAGYRVLVQAWDMVPGSNWTDRMDEGVQRSVRTIAVISGNYQQSVYGKAEWREAWASDPAGQQRKLVPIRVAGDWPPGLLRRVVGIDLVGLPEADARQRVLDGVTAAREGRIKPRTAPCFPGGGRAVPADPGFPHPRPSKVTERLPEAEQAALSELDADGPPEGNLLAPLRGQARAQLDSQLTLLADKGRLDLPWRIAYPQPADRPGNMWAGLAAASRPDYDVAILARQLRRGGQAILVGPAGCGKTMMAMLVAESLLREGDPTCPVPVRFPLASWNPRLSVSLSDWMSQLLVQLYPEVASTTGHFKALLQRGHILPILDGLDEILEPLQGEAAAAINVAMAGRPVLVTCRADDVRSSEWLWGEIPGAAVIAIEPLEAKQAASYLGRATVDERGEAWGSLVESVAEESNPPLTAALSTPLMLWLVRTVYRSEHVARAHGVDGGGSAGLLDIGRLTDRRTIEQRLLKQLVPSVFRRNLSSDTGEPNRRTDPIQAQRWLSFLASHVGQSGQIALWSLSGMAPLGALCLSLSLLAGVAYGALAILSVDLTVAAQSGLLLGLLFGFGFGEGYFVGRNRGPTDPARIGFGGRAPGTDLDLYAHSRRLGYGLAFILGSSIVAALVAYTSKELLRASFTEDIRWPPLERLAWSLLIGAIFTLIVGFVGGRAAAFVLQHAKKLDAGVGARAKTPTEAVNNDRRSGIGMLVLAWAVNSPVLAVLLLTSLEESILRTIALSLVCGAAASVGGMLLFNMWIVYKISHAWLTLRGHLPWHLTDFWDEAHRLGVLRQSGTAYEFRHALLRECLAEDGKRAPAGVRRTG